MAIQSFQLDPNAASYADLNDLDPTAASKLAGIEDNATADQDGDEIVSAINSGSSAITREDALSQDDLNIVKTNPAGGEFKIKNIHRQDDGQMDVEYDDQAV
jgi:hypothetical protein